MGRGLLALIAILVSAPVQGEEADHPGILLGTGMTDPSGDEPYDPLAWCGEKLWIDADTGVSLIDPATRKGESLSIKHFDELFLDCQFLSEKTILWTDRWGNGIVWRDLGENLSGEIGGVDHGIWGDPLLAMTGNVVVAIAAPDHTVTATSLPSDMRLVPISRQSLEPILTDLAAKQFSEPMRPSLIQLWMLDDRLFALRMNRVMPDGRFKFDSISVLQLNLVGDVAKVERHWNIENMFQLGEQDQVSGLRADQEHRLEFSVEDNDGWHKCTFIAADETNAECDVLGSSQPTGKYKLIAGRLGKEQWDLPVLTVSPSGKWTAWAEWNSGDGWDDGGRVRLYLATTANLLP